MSTKYEYTTREFGGYHTQICNDPKNLKLESEGWALIWFDRTEEQTFAVYRREKAR